MANLNGIRFRYFNGITVIDGNDLMKWIKSLPSVISEYVETITKDGDTYTATIKTTTGTKTVTWTTGGGGSTDPVYVYEMSINQQGEIIIDVGQHYEDIIDFFETNGYFPRIAGILTIPMTTNRYYVEIKQVYLSTQVSPSGSVTRLEMTGNFEVVQNTYIEYNAIKVVATPTTETATMLSPKFFDYHGSEFISVDWNEDHDGKIINFDFTNFDQFITFPTSQPEVVLTWEAQTKKINGKNAKPKMAAALNQNISNKINNSLQLPQAAPASTMLVGITPSKAQQNIKIGTGLEIVNGTLNNTGGGGGGSNPLYMHTFEFTDSDGFKYHCRSINSIPSDYTSIADMFSDVSHIVNLIGTKAGSSEINLMFLGSTQPSTTQIFLIGYDDGQLEDKVLSAYDCSSLVNWDTIPLDNSMLKKLKNKKKGA